MLKKSQHPPLTLILEADPKSVAAEAYRSLRTNLQFSKLDQGNRKLLITSATPGEGKTTTVANLGLAMAQAGGRVCLVDSDLRQPSLHDLFGVSNGIGLTVALAEAKSVDQVIVPTKMPNLYLVPSGPLPPNPGELLGSNRMHEFVENLLARFDTLLFDSAPVMSVADTAALVALSDGVILVLKSGGPPRDLVRRAVEQIEAVKGKMIGVLLSQVDPRRDGYYYRYFYQYYGGYHYGRGNGS
jgi:capsular exopolysaccharide synthesis family protein